MTAAAGPAAPPPAGLCSSCRHARRIASARSTFLRCSRSDSDARYSRYPRLPVLVCPGHEAGEPTAEGAALPDSPRE